MSTWDGVERRKAPAWAEVAALRAEVAELRNLLLWRRTTEVPALREELAEAQDLLRWRRTTDEPPDPGTPVLCVLVDPESVPTHPYVAHRTYHGTTGKPIWWRDSFAFVPPAFWRPLGPLPEQGEEE